MASSSENKDSAEVALQEAFLSGDRLERLQGMSSGLELVGYWAEVASDLGEDSRSLLSFLVSGLISRGWLAPLEASLETAAGTLDFKADRVALASAELQRRGLMQVVEGRITTLAGIFSTRATHITYFMGEDQSVHLLGALGALGVSQALGRSGEVLADCAFSDPRVRLKFICDEHGIHSRAPESAGIFLPAWDGVMHPADALRGGGFFADDDALSSWQDREGEPAGLPLSSMMFPMAVTELGVKLGVALESCLDRFANFS